MTSGDAWDERRKAQEEQYFSEQNKRALEALKDRRVLKSPVTGTPMQVLEYKGVQIDRCTDTGGIWLDRDELQKIIDAALAEAGQQQGVSGESLLKDFFGFFTASDR